MAGIRAGAAASHARDRVRHRSDDRRRACRYPARCSKGLSRPVAIPPARWRANNEEPPAVPTALFFWHDGARPPDNANGLRRTLDPISPTPIAVTPAAGIAPLLARLIDRQAATGLPPPYLPKDEQGDDT